MAASGNVYEATADYFKVIHDTLIWPTLASKDGKKPGPRPDSLVWFMEMFKKNYSRATTLLDEEPRPCVTGRNCRQDEKCEGGFCVPDDDPPSTSSFAGSGQPCQGDRDCRQDEECVNGLCSPGPIGVLNPEMLDAAPVYGADLADALERYYARLHTLILRGFAVDPKRLPAIRQLLMEIYYDAARISGKKLPTCDGPGDCPDGSACVKGYIVPVPFRLVFSASGRALWK